MKRVEVTPNIASGWHVVKPTTPDAPNRAPSSDLVRVLSSSFPSLVPERFTRTLEPMRILGPVRYDQNGTTGIDPDPQSRGGYTRPARRHGDAEGINGDRRTATILQGGVRAPRQAAKLVETLERPGEGSHDTERRYTRHAGESHRQEHPLAA
jgi:hypothetical protein